ncbi:MAG: hypothetical protein QX199_18525 [Methylococcaceae bacterium]
MMGLAVLLFFAVYLLVSIRAVTKTVGWAKANGRKPWLWGGLAAFAMYNLVFWDWIPTLIAHKYYCSTQAGFWVYKTPEQWKAENPDLTAEELKLLGESRHMLKDFHERRPLRSNSKKRVLMINQRIYHDTTYERNITILIPVHKITTFFADIKNDQKLAEEVTFGSGYGSAMTTGGILGLKGWLANSTCSNTNYVYPQELIHFINEVFTLGK